MQNPVHKENKNCAQIKILNRSQKPIEHDYVKILRSSMLNLLIENQVSLDNRKIILGYYDSHIDHKNIKRYYQHPVFKFTQALIDGNLISLTEHTSVQLNKVGIVAKYATKN